MIFIKSNVFRFFASIDWKVVFDRKLEPPIIPKVTFAGDTRNFEEYTEHSWTKEEISEEDLLLFRNF